MASGKPQNLLVPLIVSVVITVATSVTAFLFYQQTTKLNTELTSAKDTAKKANDDKVKADTQVKTLKEKIGYPDAEFGTASDAPGANTLMSQIASDFTRFLDPNTQASFTYKDELNRLANRRDDLNKELLGKTDQFNALRAEFEETRKIETAKINEHDTNWQVSKADLEKEHAEASRKEAASQQQIQDREIAANAASTKERQTAKDYLGYKERQDRIVNSLGLEVTLLKQSVEKIQSAGTAVGAVITVDNLNKQVYLDRGEADRLPLQTTFSIWGAEKIGAIHWREKNEKLKKDSAKEYEESGKRNLLAPRLDGGPKAYVEVIAILGPHQSVGRITMENVLDPITPGDQLFSPIWAPGQQRHFALGGRFDLSGKGTNDRAMLIDMIKRQGGVIDAEVKDDGTIGGEVGDIAVGTYWLVKGTMPDKTDASDPLKDFADRIVASYAELEGKAKRLGVEIVDQQKLYDFMGYKPASRKYELGGYTGAPEAAKRFDNPSNSTRPTGVQNFESGASTRPTGVPGSSPKKR